MKGLIAFASAKSFGVKPQRRGSRSRQRDDITVVLRRPLDESWKGSWTEPRDAPQARPLPRPSSTHFQLPLLKARLACMNKG